MKLFIITNNPDRPSFRQRIEIYVDTLRAKGVECEIARLPHGQLKRFRLFRWAAEFDAVLQSYYEENLCYLFLTGSNWFLRWTTNRLGICERILDDAG